MADKPVFEVTMTGFNYGGDAIGRLPDGRIVFVPFALPGERVKVRLVEEKKGHAHGELVEICQASQERIQPRCKHFTLCGGCHYQHMPYLEQLAVKASVVRDLIERIGGIKDPPVRPAVASPLEWNYRNNVQFHLSDSGKVGYLAPDSHSIVTISECHLPENALNTLWPQLDFESIPGLDRVELHLGSDEDMMLVLVGDDPQPPEFSVDLPISAVYCGPEDAMVLAGEQAVVIDILGRAFQVSARSFFQVNTCQAETLVKHILDVTQVTPLSLVLDVYCGVGLFSAFLAEHAGHVTGLEISPEACDDFSVNLDEFENVDLYVGEAERILPGLEVKPDIVLVDPPRAGVGRAALDAILNMIPARIVYVSCDPATLARDARLIVQAGYSLLQVTPFDLFPQTYHIETVSVFSRN